MLQDYNYNNIIILRFCYIFVKRINLCARTHPVNKKYSYICCILIFHKYSQCVSLKFNLSCKDAIS
jgi:hypothetical protein